jgi:hypothetical protein
LEQKLTNVTHHSANENTVAAGKKTISPADVFKALDDTEFSFLKEPREAEFASMSALETPPPSAYILLFISCYAIFLVGSCNRLSNLGIYRATGSPLFALHFFALSDHFDFATEFTAVQAEKRTNYRQKVRGPKTSSGEGGDDTEMADTTAASEEASASSGPRAKKARVDPSAAAAEDEEIDAIVDDDEVEEDEDDGDDEEAHDDDDGEEEDEDEDEEREVSGEETQDALEERRSREDAEDEALEGDESD